MHACLQTFAHIHRHTSMHTMRSVPSHYMYIDIVTGAWAHTHTHTPIHIHACAYVHMRAYARLYNRSYIATALDILGGLDRCTYKAPTRDVGRSVYIRLKRDIKAQPVHDQERRANGGDTTRGGRNLADRGLDDEAPPDFEKNDSPSVAPQRGETREYTTHSDRRCASLEEAANVPS